MGLLIMADKGTYKNINAVGNVIHYITRTRINETRRNELFGFGAMGVTTYMSPEEMIRQFCYVQNLYCINQRGGRRVYHEFYLLDEKEINCFGNNLEYLHRFAMDCCRVYFSLGFQVVYSIHYDYEKKMHIHFCVNTINYRNGKKWHDNKASLEERNKYFIQLGEKYQNMIVPIEWS